MISANDDMSDAIANSPTTEKAYDRYIRGKSSAIDNATLVGAGNAYITSQNNKLQNQELKLRVEKAEDEQKVNTEYLELRSSFEEDLLNQEKDREGGEFTSDERIQRALDFAKTIQNPLVRNKFRNFIFTDSRFSDSTFSQQLRQQDEVLGRLKEAIIKGDTMTMLDLGRSLNFQGDISFGSSQREALTVKNVITQSGINLEEVPMETKFKAGMISEQVYNAYNKAVNDGDNELAKKITQGRSDTGVATTITYELDGKPYTTHERKYLSGDATLEEVYKEMEIQVIYGDDGIPKVLTNLGKTIDQNFNVNNWKDYNLLSGKELKREDFNKFFNPEGKTSRSSEGQKAANEFVNYDKKLQELKAQRKKNRDLRNKKNREPKDLLNYYKITLENFERLTREEQIKYMKILSGNTYMQENFLASQNTPVSEGNITSNKRPSVQILGIED